MKPGAMVLSFTFLLSLAALGLGDDGATAAPNVIDLWPSAPPGESGTIAEEKVTRKEGDPAIRSLTNVSKPTLKICRPEKSKDTGVAVIICPGGGYTNLAWDHEGEQVARWLNSIGVTGVILKYRVPRREGTPKDQPPPQALMDAQRALSVVRSKAGEWGVDAKKIGILGFSAGGHLVTWASTNFDHRAYEPTDAIDKIDCRPDFAVAIYPGGVMKRRTHELAPEIRISGQTPPMFLAHAGDDGDTAEGSIQIWLALKKAKVPAELHIYNSGGHGFGMRPTGKPASTWPQRCEEWLRDIKILGPLSASKP
jgi:acetyl esterase/lipase